MPTSLQESQLVPVLGQRNESRIKTGTDRQGDLAHGCSNSCGKLRGVYGEAGRARAEDLARPCPGACQWPAWLPADKMDS